jgi:hypothetical protein
MQFVTVLTIGDVIAGGKDGRKVCLADQGGSEAENGMRVCTVIWKGSMNY